MASKYGQPITNRIQSYTVPAVEDIQTYVSPIRDTVYAYARPVTDIRDTIRSGFTGTIEDLQLAMPMGGVSGLVDQGFQRTGLDFSLEGPGFGIDSSLFNDAYGAYKSGKSSIEEALGKPAVDLLESLGAGAADYLRSGSLGRAGLTALSDFTGIGGLGDVVGDPAANLISDVFSGASRGFSLAGVPGALVGGAVGGVFGDPNFGLEDVVGASTVDFLGDVSSGAALGSFFGPAGTFLGGVGGGIYSLASGAPETYEEAADRLRSAVGPNYTTQDYAQIAAGTHPSQTGASYQQDSRPGFQQLGLSGMPDAAVQYGAREFGWNPGSVQVGVNQARLESLQRSSGYDRSQYEMDMSGRINADRAAVNRARELEALELGVHSDSALQAEHDRQQRDGGGDAGSPGQANDGSDRAAGQEREE